MKSSDLSAPLVSVVIPVYNRETTVGRAAASVLNQSYTNLELIIVDDCSNDNSLQVIHEFQDKRIIVITSEQNSGANAARNKGILAAKGQYVAFQDSDDEWVKDKLKIQMQDMINRDLSASFLKEQAPCLVDSLNSSSCFYLIYFAPEFDYFLLSTPLW